MSVDDADYEYLNSFKWYAQKSSKNCFYAVRCVNVDGKKKHVYMHRHLLGITDKNVCVDHIDRDSLNNQRSNLRTCTKAENLMNRGVHPRNTSGFKGVTFDPPTKKWRARLMVNRKNLHVGLFNSAEDAALAYNKAAKKHFGEFALLNKVA